MSELTTRENIREGVIVQIDESVENEGTDEMKWWAALAFSLHSFDQYHVGVRVVILDRGRYHSVDNDNRRKTTMIGNRAYSKLILDLAIVD